MRLATFGAAVLACLAGTAHATARSWSGAMSTSWNTAGNWSPSGVPGSTDDVTISGGSTGITIDTNVDVASITVSGACTSAIAPSGAQTIRTRGDFTLSSTAAGGSFTLSSATTRIDGKFNLSNANMSVVGNGGTLILDATSPVTHTFSGASLAKVNVGGDSGLVGYWKLDEASGTAIIDSSGNGNDGTLAGGYSRTTPPAAITFSDANAVTLNGTSGYATLGINSLPATNAIQSMSAWVNFTSSGGTQNMISLSDNSTSAVQLGIRGGALVVWGWGGGTLVSATVPSTGVWHHIAYTWDGTTNRLYVDGGTAVTSTTAHQSATVTKAYLGTYNGGSELYGGSLDDVRIYNRVLSGSEVTTFASGAAPSGTTQTFGDAFVSTGTLTISGGTLTGSSTLSVGGSWLNGGTFSGSGAVTLTGTTSTNVITSGGSSLASLTVNGSGGTYTTSDALVTTGGLTITAGTLTSAYAVTVSGTVSNAGTLSGGGAISVGGNWSNTGTFSGTGTVTLTGTGPGGTILSGGGTFGGLTLNGAGGTYTLLDRLWVPGGTVTLTNGTLAAGSYTAHVGSFVQTSGSFSAGTGTVVFDGSSNQTLPFGTFNGLRIEDPTESNLVAYWKLDEGAGSSFRDLSGSGNTGTISAAGATWQAAVPATIGFDDNASLVLNGTSGYASMGATNLPANNASQTISLWAKLTSTSGSQNMVVLTNASGSAIQLGIRAGNLAAWGWGGVGLVSVSPPSTGVWHHIVYTNDGASGQKLYVDGTVTSATATSQTATPTIAYLGTYNGAGELYNGSIDDVRVYNVALTSTQISQLAAGRYAGAGGYATVTLGANTTVSGPLALDDGILDANGKTLSASLTSAAAQVNTGTYTVGSAAQTFSGGLTVQPLGTLTLASSSGSVSIASGKTLTIDGTLSASSTGATIKSVSGSYAFQVGSTATATPTLNITGLAVKNTDSNGLQINANTSATTTFTRFDNIAFSSGTGTQLLQIYAKALYLASNLCSFDSGSATGTTTYAVRLTGNGSTGSPDTTETRAVFGGTTCANNWTVGSSDRSCLTVAQGTGTTAKSDDDSDGNGVGNTPASNGSVVQFARSAESDTAGTIVGAPTAAFDWNTFTYYSTYVAYNSASGTSAIVYVRSGTGAAQYAWTAPTGETLVGTPRWNTVGSTHYLYVAVASGKIYRLVDNGSSSLALDAGWTTNPYDCSCTIVTPLAMDTSNLYWGGTQSGAQKLWTLGQSSSAQPMGSPFTVTPTITSAAPALWTSGGTSYLFLGFTGHVIEVNVTNQVNSYDNTNPGSASINGRIAIGTSGSTRVFAGDSAGTLWALDPTAANFTGTQKIWSYSGPASQIGSPHYDYTTNTVQYGTAGGAVVSLDSTGTGLTGYPYTPGSASDSITSAPLYLGGVLIVGTTTGKLFFLDRKTGSGVSLIREYNFGPTESVSGISYDANTNRYMVTTGDTSAKDGRLYYFDLVADPTPGSS